MAGSERKGVHRGSPAYYAHIDYAVRTPLQQAMRWVLRLVWRVVARVEIDGLERVPLTGGLLLAVNHVYILDTPLFLGLYPRRMVVMVLARWRRWPVVGWFVKRMGDAIYVSRGGINKEAIACALRVLEAGGCIGITPEGTVSKARTLVRGNSGVAFLATRTGAPVLPAVAWGQEKALRHWVRLRRVPIRMRFGEPMRLENKRANGAQLDAYTAQIMARLSELLPPEYRGVYEAEGPIVG